MSGIVDLLSEFSDFLRSVFKAESQSLANVSLDDPFWNAISCGEAARAYEEFFAKCCLALKPWADWFRHKGKQWIVDVLVASARSSRSIEECLRLVFDSLQSLRSTLRAGKFTCLIW